jgi:outer membrane protein OmpA-like peptidoglycan-associated protein
MFLFVLISVRGFSEEPEKNKARKNVEFTKKNFTKNIESLDFALAELKMGDQYYEYGNWLYVDALFHYLNAYTVNPDNAELNYKIGKSYLNTFNKQDALPYLQDAYMLDPEVSADVKLLLAEAYQINFKFDSAIVYYNDFLNEKSRKVYDEDFARAELGIKQSRNAIIMVADPKPFVIGSTGNSINGLYPDYCPVISSDGKTMYYTSRRPGTTGGERDQKDFKYNEDIYKAELINGTWVYDAGSVKFNSDNHDATVGLSADGKTMLVYRGSNGGDLYYSQLSGWNEWTDLKPLENLNTEYKESSAAISPNGQKLYFTSDRPGGYGGLDIYVSQLKTDGSWGTPVNLGPTINSQYDEEGVSLNGDGTVLYFSSNGTRSMGGYDVFKSQYGNNAWTTPENLGYPLNTPEDDVFFTFTGDEKMGYFSSEREDGYGSQDIYSVEMIPQRNPMIVLNGLVIDKLSGTLVEYSDVMITDEDGIEIGTWNDLGLGTPMYSVDVESGKTYHISVRSEGYIGVDEDITIGESNENSADITHITELSLLDIRSLTLPNVFFDFDKSDLRQAAIDDLNYVIKVLNDYPSIQLELSGNTDIIGPWDYNLALSHTRAITVYNYLTSHGISPERLIISWHSFDMPWGDNSTDNGRQLNRRTELKIVSHNN